MLSIHGKLLVSIDKSFLTLFHNVITQKLLVFFELYINKLSIFRFKNDEKTTTRRKYTLKIID